MSSPTQSDSPTATDLGRQFASHIKGKTVLITGPSPDSIAAQFAVAVAPNEPHLIILAGRSAAKLDATAQEVKKAAPNCPTRNLVVDFGSLGSVRNAVKEVNAYSEDLDILMLSAGIMAPPYSKTEDGFENSFATNHLGHFLFANSVMGKVQAAAKNNAGGSRIVSVSSEGHALAGIGKNMDEINFNDGKTYNQWRSYGQSKTANVLFAKSLSDKLSSKYNIQSFSLHPGVITTSSLGNGKKEEEWKDLFRVRDELANSLSQERREASTNALMKPNSVFQPVSVDQGAANYMIAGFDPAIKNQTGAYLATCKVDPDGVADHAKDPQEAERLWKISEDCVGQTFVY